MIRMEDASKIKQRLFHYFMALAKGSVRAYWTAKMSAFRKNCFINSGTFWFWAAARVLGLNRIRLAYTAGGEAIGPEIFDFYRSLGINIKQLWADRRHGVHLRATRW